MVKISVIMPVYNDEEYLSQAIDSILNQNLGDIEIICVNDGSTDSSLDILESYADKFDFIKVFTKDNEGSGIARNFGLEKSSGDFIAYLDSDDIFVNENALKLMYASAVKNDAVMVSANLKGLALNGKLVNNENLKRFDSDGMIAPEEYGIPYSFYKNIFRREFLLENNLQFPDLLRGQDPVFLAEILTLVDEIPTVNVDLYGFRYSRRSDLLKMNTYRKRHDYIMHFKDTFDILENAGLTSMKENYEDKLLEFIKAFHNPYTQEVKDIFYDVFGDDGHILNLAGDVFINPKVSVIITSFDGEYLEKSITQLLKQSIEKIEVLCICNNDNEILNEFSLKDSRIRIINQKFESISQAKNIALNYAAGEYVYFYNSKDKLEKDTLNVAYNSAFNNNSDLVIFKANTFDEKGINEVNVFNNYDLILDRKDYDNFSYEDIKGNVLKDQYVLSSRLFKKEFLDDNLKFATDSDFEDILFNIKSIFKAENISFVNRVLLHVATEALDYDYLDLFNIIDSVEDYLKTEGHYDDFKSEFDVFASSAVFKFILLADSDEYFETAKKYINNVDSDNINVNDYLMDSYLLLLNFNSFKEFKPFFKTLNLRRELDDYKLLFEELKQVRSKLKNENKRIDGMNKDLLNSKSWKITKPLRKLKKSK